MIKRITIPILLSVLATTICAAQAPGYPYGAAPANPGYSPYGAAPTSSGYSPYGAAPASSGYSPYGAAPANPGYNPYGAAPANPYADPLASGYVPYASAPALGYNPYAAAQPAPAYNPYPYGMPSGPDPSAYAAAPPTLTPDIRPVTPPWETGAIPWPVPWPTQAAREWMPELAQPWIPGTGRPLQQAPVQPAPPAPNPAPASASTPVYFIIASPIVTSEPPAARVESSANMAKVIPRMPSPQDTNQYWVQVGAYKTRSNALAAFNRAAGVGFNPAYETSRGFIRVVIPGVRGSEMREIAERLYRAGFKEILLRDKP
ncbi:hypothetical protein AGMMS4952_07270 [Spirochaetia bacterium]|nr:hypothetical protein AGMMS4952_07270 [Spirochaetia bacterium]